VDLTEAMARLEIDFLTNYDDASLLAELRRIAKVTGSDTVTRADIERIGRIHRVTLTRRFGSLRRALQLAGLKPTRFTKATDDELLAIIIDLWQQVIEKEGRSPQQDDLQKYGFPVSPDTINRRFGTWRKALVRAHGSITEKSISDQETAAAEITPRKREPLSLRKRFFVLKRDHFACVRCGASGVGVRLEVHHRFPFAKGGSDKLVNLETLCYDCNRGPRDNVV
jgi:5-methylcytosine-specific restriction endonuclease McrA